MNFDPKVKYQRFHKEHKIKPNENILNCNVLQINFVSVVRSLKMATVTMETTKMSKIAKCTKVSETLQKWYLPCEGLMFDFGFFF